MKNLHYIFILFLSITINTKAQSIFQKTFGGSNYDSGNSVQQTTDGGFIIGGTTLSFGAGNSDVYLIKTNANGDSLWTKTFGGLGQETGEFVQQTADGGYIITGATSGFGAGNNDVYLLKTDSIGNLLWSKTYGGINDDKAFCVKQTTDSGYVIAGQTNSFGAGNADAYLIKTDANGDTLWTKTFGGGFNDFAFFVQQTSDTGYIITGQTISFGAGNSDVYLIKTDTIGNLIWSKTFGGTNVDVGHSVEQTSDGGYIIAGNTTSFGFSNSHVYLIKTNSSGNLIWSKILSTLYSFSIQQTTDGGYIIAGSSIDIDLIKTDSTGNLLWIKSFGGGSIDRGTSLQSTTDGGYIITGWAASFGTTLDDVYLIKTDSSGNGGCNQTSPSISGFSPSTQVSNPTTVINYTATIDSTPATIISFGGTVRSLCFAVTEIESIITVPKPELSIYPNPSAGNFNVSFNNTIEKGFVKILNILGETILTEDINHESSKEIKLNNISRGIYFVNVFDGERNFSKRIVIQ